ncbi:class I adenylate-forming enzyme family protein [Chloroflexota bacterium]
MNLKLMLEQTAEQYATKTALILGERHMSYAELDKTSNKVANALIKIGVRKGDRVAMILPNSPEFIINYFGIIKTGGIAVPLDTRYKIEELVSLFDNCKPKVLISRSPFLEPIVPVLPQFDSIEHIIDLSPNYEGQFISYREIIASSPVQGVNVEIATEDVGTISYTGGPSTQPRGAAFTHSELCTQALMSANGLLQTDKDRVMLFALPMYHMFALGIVLLSSIYKGSTIIMVPGTGISIGSLMETIEREKGTMLLVVPYIFALAIKMARREGVKNDLSSLRLCGSGGAPLSINVIRQFKQYYGLTIADLWGLTEAVALVSHQPMYGTVKLGSSGKALPCWELKIVDDSDKELPPNQPGEIIIRGPFMKGYYNNPQATAAKIRSGWLHTGDMGRIDEDGFLFLTGRKKSVIILKGQNVYPEDIETVLSTHPKIAAIKVVGIPDRLRGEIVRAFIVLKEGEAATEQEIRHFCQEHMADYKSPKQIIFVDALPDTATARMNQKNLKEYLANLSPLPPVPHQGKAKL